MISNWIAYYCCTLRAPDQMDTICLCEGVEDGVVLVSEGGIVGVRIADIIGKVFDIVAFFFFLRTSYLFVSSPLISLFS